MSFSKVFEKMLYTNQSRPEELEDFLIEKLLKKD